MDFTSSYFHAFGNPDFAAVFSGGGGGSAQAIRPGTIVDGHAATSGAVKAVNVSRGAATARQAAPSVFCVQDTEVEEAHHFLDECSLCRKFLAGDIFMYRGDTPFCSEECRREQMEADEAAERRETARAGKLTRGAPPHREVEGPQERSSSVRAGSILAL
ncbi:hypothetical protein E2562_019300 [Oryza meyeriana var. granulata]|uniref:FLZ-type domain-containing protein n=1 Tax=Oryza meyeriana var. granulata TaxID=110450 RepID=A0A6G1FA97_9ORYZ|nr:hypothetical protein E2562_019300 [Oryza meyeriana var. granulata]